jgi:putative chitinase
MRPVDVVRKLCPRGRMSYLSAFENGDALFREHGITTRLRLAHFLAQCLHETGGLTIEWESGNYSADRLMQIFGVGHHSAALTEAEAQQLAHNGPAIFERVYGLGNPRKARELGNTQPGDGFKYRGGGIMQTTGRANYRRMGAKCGVDFEAMPSLVLSAEHALKPALAEWTEGNLNAAADRDDIQAITKRINGGYNGLTDRQVWLQKAKAQITSVELKDVAPAPQPVPAPKPAPLPVPPVVAPAPIPTPAPTNTARNTTVGGGLFATIIAAAQAHKVEIALAIMAVGILAFVAIHFLWPKKRTTP